MHDSDRVQSEFDRQPTVDSIAREIYKGDHPTFGLPQNELKLTWYTIDLWISGKSSRTLANVTMFIRMAESTTTAWTVVRARIDALFVLAESIVWTIIVVGTFHISCMFGHCNVKYYV